MVSQLSSGKVQRQTDTCNNRVLMYRIIYFMPCLCLPQFSHLYDGELWMPSFLCAKLLSKHPAELAQVTTQQKDIHGNKFHPTCKVQTLLFLKPFSSRDNLYFFFFLLWYCQYWTSPKDVLWKLTPLGPVDIEIPECLRHLSFPKVLLWYLYYKTHYPKALADMTNRQSRRTF